MLDQKASIWSSRSFSSVPVFRLDIVGHTLWLLVAVVAVVMWVIGGPDISHLVYASALIASLMWSLS